MQTAIEGPIFSVLLSGTCGHREIPVKIFKLKGSSVHFEGFLIEQAALILPKNRQVHELLSLWVQHALGQIPDEFWDPRFNPNIRVPRTHKVLPVNALDSNGRVSLFPNIDASYRSMEHGLRVTKPDEFQLSQDYFS